MPPRDTYGVSNGVVSRPAAPATPESRGFGNGAVDPAAPSVGYGEGQVDPRLASAAGIGPTLAGSEPAAAPAAGGGGGGSGGGGSESVVVPVTETGRGGNTEPERTEILDPPRAPVEITLDTFLQSAGGGITPCGGGGGLLGALGAGNLASGLLGDLLGNLPPAAQGLLNATGLTGALAGIAGEIDGQISAALGEMSQALNEAAGAIFQDISGAVSNIPGLGPAIENITGAVNGFSDNLQAGFAGLDPVLQQGIAGAVGAIGANINNPILRTGFNTLFTPAAARNIAQGVQFNLNPALQIEQLAGAAGRINPIMNEFFGNNAFGELQARATRASQQLNRAVVPSTNGFGLTLELPGFNPNVSRVINGVIQNPEGLISEAQTEINNRLQQITSGGFSIRF